MDTEVRMLRSSSTRAIVGMKPLLADVPPGFEPTNRGANVTSLQHLCESVGILRSEGEIEDRLEAARMRPTTYAPARCRAARRRTHRRPRTSTRAEWPGPFAVPPAPARSARSSATAAIRLRG